MNDERFLAVIAGILEVDPTEVTLADDLDASGWDSLSNISFIAEIDDALGVTLEADALADAKTVADLRALVPTAHEG